MDRTEELKQKFIEDWQPSDQHKSTQNQNFQFELSRLLDEVSRERAIEFGRWKQQSRYELMSSDYTEFMEWKSNKEDKQNIK